MKDCLKLLSDLGTACYIGSLHLCIFIIFDGGSLMAETEGIWPENT